MILALGPITAPIITSAAKPLGRVASFGRAALYAAIMLLRPTIELARLPRVMQPRMLAWRQHRQVLRSIICFAPIEVMNRVGIGQWSPDGFAGDRPMLVDVALAGNANTHVGATERPATLPIGATRASLGPSQARARAELDLAPTMTPTGDAERYPAPLAGMDILTLHRRFLLRCHGRGGGNRARPSSCLLNYTMRGA